MNDFSLVERLKILMNVVLSSPLFLILAIIILLLLIFFVVGTIFNKKINKWFIISTWLILGLVIVIKYNKVFIELIDNLFDSLFMALYFPSLSIYILLLITSNFFFVYSIINKRINKWYKVVNITNALVIDMFLIIILDVVNKNNINIYDELVIFSNSNLLVLLELSTAVFTSWLLLNLLISAHQKLKIYNNKQIPEIPEIIFD